MLITRIDESSRAYAHGLRAGDVLVAANRQPVRKLEDLRDAAWLSRGRLLLRVYRAGDFGYVSIR